MEWMYGASESSNMEVDIGYLPQVQLQFYIYILQARRERIVTVNVTLFIINYNI